MRTVDGCVLCAARCLKNQCQLWGCRNSCCSVVRGGFRAPTEGVEGHGRALLTQAEGRVHCIVTQVRTGGKPRTTAGNLFQGVVCEQNRDLGHRSCKPLDQGHSPLLAARLVHPELWMRMATEMDKALHALAGVSKLLPGLSSGKTCQTWHTTVIRAKGLLPEEIPVSKAECKFTAPDYFVLCSLCMGCVTLCIGCIECARSCCNAKSVLSIST